MSAVIEARSETYRGPANDIRQALVVITMHPVPEVEAVGWRITEQLTILEKIVADARDLTRSLLEADGPCPSCGVDTAEQEIEQHEPDCALMALSKAVR